MRSRVNVVLLHRDTMRELMQIAGHVESLWRYPVKSMRGEELPQLFLGFPGVYGDRLYAVGDAAAQKVFPYLTARQQQEMLLYRPMFRGAEHMTLPTNAAETEALALSVTPVYAAAAASMVDVETPAGERLAIDDPRLLEKMREGLRERHELSLLRCDRPMTDCRPISLFSVQSAAQLGQELGSAVDKRRFRANLYLDLADGDGFGENGFVGRTLQIGEKVQVAVTDRDPRCKMITLDPDTAEANPEVMRLVARAHDGKAGVYGAVLVEGTVRVGDAVQVV